ncbi:alpha/beta hydrolase fold domain-containing protein [Chitinophaga sancti]|uniref:Acetyl esterase/lipase n=1 Tax=Chitinophaga sancti TaxID=1004 RepID=A0A1K1S537_9BACT|nr:alpha/beta hydrolase [Chitinophaga sancti]WQD63690.1 alpha/beta hydrolase [Chitinophaga sancti]WQG90685.1 alpha/beta hydrolase [Chitinophaga sancti]SFW79314.1 Acetyl esterase/lipase [Chitinophaga sancti]
MEDIKTHREFFDSLGTSYPAAAGVTITPGTISDVPVYWIEPAEAAAGKLLVYLHGGAFAVGSITSHGPMVSHFAKAAKRKVLFIDYALAPENPYPAGLNDVLKVYATLNDVDVEMMGDSAGGGLILSVIAAVEKAPKAVVLLSPWIRLESDLPSHEVNAGKDVIATEYLHDAAKAYAGVSPDSLRFDAFPPVLILAGGQEILLDDSRTFHARIPQSRLVVYEGKQHVWPLTNIDTPETLAEIAQFLTAGY